MDASNLNVQLEKMRVERDHLRQERDELQQRLSKSGVDIMDRLGPLLDQMSHLQDALFEDYEQTSGITEQCLSTMGEWLADAEYRNKVAANKAITHAFREFESRSLAQRLRARVRDPAVKMPPVPLLLCVNPASTGIVCVTCHPGTSFGLDGTGDLVFGSASYVDRIQALTKRARFVLRVFHM